MESMPSDATRRTLTKSEIGTPATTNSTRCHQRGRPSAASATPIARNAISVRMPEHASATLSGCVVPSDICTVSTLPTRSVSIPSVFNRMSAPIALQSCKRSVTRDITRSEMVCPKTHQYAHGNQSQRNEAVPNTASRQPSSAKPTPTPRTL